MPWVKLYSEVYKDPDLNGMPLAQQAVFFRLLAYANEQEERGAFDISDMGKLTRAIAPGERETLESALHYMEHEWKCLIIENGRARFRRWDRYQRNPSDEPAAIAARQAAFQARQITANNGEITSNNGHMAQNNGPKKEEGRRKNKDEDAASPPPSVPDKDPLDWDTCIGQVILLAGLHGKATQEMVLRSELRRHFGRGDMLRQTVLWSSKIGDERATAGRKASSLTEWFDRLPKAPPSANVIDPDAWRRAKRRKEMLRAPGAQSAV